MYGFSPFSRSKGASASLTAASASSMLKDVAASTRVDVLRRANAGAPAEDHEVTEGVAAQSVRAVHAAGRFTGGEEPGHHGRGGVGDDLDAAHDVVTGRSDLHRLRA